MIDEQKLFGNITLETFLSHIWGKKFHHILDGTLTQSMLSWEDLNHALTCFNLRSPRFRVSHCGQIVPESEYLDLERRKREDSHYISPSKIRGLLNEGAVLILDSVDEMFPKVAKVAGDLTQLFGDKAQVNCYLSGPKAEGFDLHWDDHDVFISQQFGSKEWDVRSYTRKYPIRDDVEGYHEPSNNIVWEGTLEQSQALYIPRGWWHKAQTSSDYSCHLTFGITQSTYLDLIRYVLQKAKFSVNMRSDLPKDDGQIDQETLKGFQLLLNEVTLQEYWSNKRATLQPRRVKHSLSYGVGVPVDEDTFIELTFFHTPKIETFSEGIFFEVFGQKWKFVSKTKIFFEVLFSLTSSVSIKTGLSLGDCISLSKVLISNDLVSISH